MRCSMNNSDIELESNLTIKVPEDLLELLVDEELDVVITDVVDIDEDWSLLFFEADEMVGYIEEIEEDDGWCYYLGLDWGSDDENVFLDEDDRFKETIIIEGESFDLEETDQDINYVSTDENHEGVFEYADYIHKSKDIYLRIIYWDDDEEFDSFISVEISEEDIIK